MMSSSGVILHHVLLLLFLILLVVRFVHLHFTPTPFFIQNQWFSALNNSTEQLLKKNPCSGTMVTRNGRDTVAIHYRLIREIQT